MLAFMTDQQGNTQEGPMNRNNISPQQDEAQQAMTATAQNAHRARQSSMALMVLFCMGAIGLFVMIKKTQPRAVGAAPIKSESSQIEAAIKRLTGLSDELAIHMDQLMQRFRQISTVAQVAVEELVKNPFELELLAGMTQQPQAIQPEQTEPNISFDQSAQLQAQDQARIEAEQERRRLAEIAARQKAEEAKRLQIRQAAATLRLQGIVQTADKGICIIDGQVLTIGQKIKGFELIGIKADSVQLRWPEPEMTLTLKIAE